jgi:SAM-dependent methyltransferase
MEKHPDCPLCNGGRTRPRFRHGEYTIFACNSCGGGFAWPRLGPAGLGGVYDDAYAQTYASGVMYGADFAKRRFAQLEKSLQRHAPALLNRPSARMLDIGCASGGLLAEFRGRGWRAEGVEYSEALAAQARSRGLDVHVGDFLSLPLAAGTYDLITMFHVIEHFDDPSAAVARCHDLLRDGGVLVMETPNWRGVGALLRGARWSHIVPPEHLNYFGPAALCRLVRRGGFVATRAVTITPQVIEAVAAWPRPAVDMARTAYRLAALLGLGTTVQVFARKGDSLLTQQRESLP